MLRMFMSVALTCYFLYAVQWRELIHPRFVIVAFAFYAVGGLLILAASISFPERINRRIKLGICLDHAAALFAMAYGGVATVMFFGALLWVVIGNGLRFGRKTLHFAATVSLITLGCVLLINPFWHQNQALGVALMVWLVVLPTYVGVLLHRLEQATATIDRANKAQRQFLANMSHEIRTPLTAIIGFAEASLDSDQSMQERMTGLKTIVQNGTHLHKIVDDVLDFSKIEAEKLVLEQVDTDLIALVHAVTSALQPKATQKGIVFKVEYQLPLPSKIVTDPVRLKQILINLCNNAIKFTEHGFVLLQIQADFERQELSLSVIDTGIGLTEQQISTCLNPYEQAETPLSRKQSGTGLGLPISNRLLTLMGGKLNVSSTPEKGSCFEAIINLPPLSPDCLIEDLSQLNAHQESLDQQSRTQGLYLKGDVLLVDNNETNQQLFSMFLRRMGVNVTCVNSGINALKETVNKEFDLIYMDMHMPHLSGLDTVAKIREIGYKYPIVALTAHATAEFRQKCLRSGCDDFLAKPVLRSQFEQMTAKFLQPAVQPAAMDEAIPIFSSLLENEPEFSDLVEKFVSDLHSTQSTIEQLVEEENWTELKSVLHTLKGTAGGLGYPVLTDIAGKIEFQLISENYEAVQNLTNNLNSIFSRIFEGMQLTQQFTDYANRLP